MYDVLSNELDIAIVIEEENFTVTLMFYTDRFTYHRCQTMKYIHKCNYIDVGFLSSSTTIFMWQLCNIASLPR